ncbi:MAG: NFACT family protein [Acidobacteria bacterium]|nr:NFACT family protein [Acidobacteriota bacterium]
MNTQTLDLITAELSAELTGRRLGRIFQLGRGEIAFDLRPSGSRYLYLDIRPAEPAAYLITRRLKDLERASGSLLPFAHSLKKRVSGAEIISIERIPNERVLNIALDTEDEFGTAEALSLIVQLTGRSANVFLTGADDLILDRARDTLGNGQQIGEKYAPPERAVRAEERSAAADQAVAAGPETPSESLDTFYTAQAAEQKFESVARAASGKIASELRKREKLIANLQNDLTTHGDAGEWKRLGDLLLSNVATARREGPSIIVTDYFDELLPEIAVQADENDSVTETAEKYFRRYTKARNAAAQLSQRLEKLNAEMQGLERQRTAIEKAIEERDNEFLETAIAGKQPAAPQPGKRKLPETGGVARRFTSSDGFEILVGKRAKDNDVLTFKVAKSLDTWMHAADYPGSHVVIRNPNRAEIPHRTLLEAAQLAAFYSQGKAQVKAAVHYTQKKFVNKPKGAAPGLVSLASFKTLLVEPGVPEGVTPA